MTTAPHLALVPVAPAEIIPAPLAPDRNPVAVYLGRLSAGSRPTMLTALGNMALILATTPKASKADRDAAAVSTQWWKLGYQHVQRLRQLMVEKGMAPGTVNRHLAALRGVLLECRRLELMGAEEHARASDVKDVKNNRMPAGRMLSEEEMTSLFNHVHSARDAAILAVMYACGLRRAEVAALDVADVTMEAETAALRVRHGKGDKERVIPLNHAMVEIRAWLAERGDAPGPLFLNHHGRGLTPQGIYHVLVHRIAEAAGVAKVSPHSIRRTFASVAIENSKDIFSVQNLMGHSNSDTTKRYDRRGEGAMRKVIDGIEIPRRK